MQSHINEKILVIRPYISTNWQNVEAIHMEEGAEKILVITLKSGSKISIPNLSDAILDQVFTFHAKAVEMQSENTSSRANNMQKTLHAFLGDGSLPGMENLIGLGPFKLSGGLEGVAAAMQHNPNQANAPDLPLEVLQKISSVAKVLMGNESIVTPKPEPHCNCIHCQIAKALHQGLNEDKEEMELEEEVSDDDLRFKSWDIQQSGSNLYTVSNPLDAKEQYSVYLGDPIGCTCGEKNCEHIKAVLNS